MKNVSAVILAGGQGQRLSIISELRAKPAVPFGGKYRLIDFTLSNCVNSGISWVYLLTQYKPRSLQEHIEIGRPWDLDRMNGGVILLQPSLGAGTKDDWYSGTANAVYQNINHLNRRSSSEILILSGDHVYKMDYSKMVQFHRKNKADATIAVMTVDYKETSRFGIMQLNNEGRIIEFEEKPQLPKSNLASMGIYLFDRNVLETVLLDDATNPKSSHDFGKDIIPGMIHSSRVFGYEFQGYWRDVGTIPSYFQANMDLLEEPPLFDLDDPDWLIYTKSEEKPPVKLNSNAKVIQSIVAHGCVIDGYVEHSILFPGVIIEKNTSVHNSIIFNNSIIRNSVKLDHVISDKMVEIDTGCHIGTINQQPSSENPFTIIGKGTHIPSKTIIESGCVIDYGLRQEHFLSKHIPAGTIFRKK